MITLVTNATEKEQNAKMSKVIPLKIAFALKLYRLNRAQLHIIIIICVQSHSKAVEYREKKTITN